LSENGKNMDENGKDLIGNGRIRKIFPRRKDRDPTNSLKKNYGNTRGKRNGTMRSSLR